MLINEAADTVYQGIATEEDVESAMVLGTNYPRGLFQWAREFGIEEVKKTLKDLYETYHEDRYRISPFLANGFKRVKTFQ